MCLEEVFYKQHSRFLTFGFRQSLYERIFSRCLFEQGPGGCAAIDWDNSLSSYLRHILVARVYDVAVRPADFALGLDV
jgi:hypothetical protein